MSTFIFLQCSVNMKLLKAVRLAASARLGRHTLYNTFDVQEYTPESLSFMSKLLQRSGVGPEAYMPDGALSCCKADA